MGVYIAEKVGIDYFNGDALGSSPSSSPEECCAQCASTLGCNYFAYKVSNSICYFKSDNSGRRQDPDVTSGEGSKFSCFFHGKSYFTFFLGGCYSNTRTVVYADDIAQATKEVIRTLSEQTDHISVHLCYEIDMCLCVWCEYRQSTPML